jgi:hypothetical protein
MPEIKSIVRAVLKSIAWARIVALPRVVPEVRIAWAVPVAPVVTDAVVLPPVALVAAPAVARVALVVADDVDKLPADVVKVTGTFDIPCPEPLVTASWTGTELTPSATSVVSPVGVDRASLTEFELLAGASAPPPEALHPWRHVAVRERIRRRVLMWVCVGIRLISSRLPLRWIDTQVRGIGWMV